VPQCAEALQGDQHGEGRYDQSDGQCGSRPSASDREAERGEDHQNDVPPCTVLGVDDPDSALTPIELSPCTIRGPSEQQGQRLQFLKNMAMLGGLLFAVIDSPKKTPIKYRTGVKPIQSRII
jgi:hypothetical protein